MYVKSGPRRQLGKRCRFSLIAGNNGVGGCALDAVSILIPLLLLARAASYISLHVEPEKYRILSITKRYEGAMEF
ncbi:hypothetical protein KCP77_16405 [Salmonella enterica subsp. enterica]|nr:hypothetical protein KCP77_16405 [Salmonella enterica subsp. enterica]